MTDTDRDHLGPSGVVRVGDDITARTPSITIPTACPLGSAGDHEGVVGPCPPVTGPLSPQFSPGADAVSCNRQAPRRVQSGSRRKCHRVGAVHKMLLAFGYAPAAFDLPVTVSRKRVGHRARRDPKIHSPVTTRISGVNLSDTSSDIFIWIKTNGSYH